MVKPLWGSVVPSSDLYAITLAHMAGEFKRPGSGLLHARIQAAHDEAGLTYSHNAARRSTSRADQAGIMHIGSFVSDGMHNTTFTYYAADHTSGKTVYHQWPVTDTNIQQGPINVSNLAVDE